MNNILLITFQTLKFNFTFTAKRVPEVDNSIADSLSRFQMPHFCLLAPDASPVPSVIPPFPTNVQPYRWPISSTRQCFQQDPAPTGAAAGTLL